MITVDDRVGLRLVRADGSQVLLPLPALRDRCECTECQHPGGQRLVDPACLPVDLHAEVVHVDNDSLQVVWQPERHHSTYSLAALALAPIVPPAAPLWTAEDADLLVRAAHCDLVGEDTESQRELLRWLRGVAAMGCGVMTGVPIEDGEVARVAELFGFVRRTNYGRWFDVRTHVDPTNLANTSLGLPPHTDNPYRDPVPTMQLLHCHHTSASGGLNVLVDGWRVADELRQLDPAGFLQLVARSVTFAYRGDGAVLRTAAPLIELEPNGTVRAVRSNHRSLQQLPAASSDTEAEALADWYRGYSLFARLVADASFHIQVQLQPGDLFIVDNRRVLHGRTAYDSNGGTRHLQGCYADIDGLHSTIRVLEATLDQPVVVQ